MSDQETLTKAIEIAIENGWKPYETFSGYFHVSTWNSSKGEMLNNPEQKLGIFIDRDMPGFGYLYHAGDVLYDHDFARALWGENMFRWQSVQSGAYYGIKGAYIEGALPLYMFHLIGMSLSDSPLDYLKENMPE
jgi:hypothetical protein